MYAYDEKVKKYLIGHGWRKKICPSCGSIFYSKRDIKTCQSLECEHDFSFLSFSKRKKFTSLEDLAKLTKAFFERCNYRFGVRNTIINTIGDTFFIVAGVQYFDGVLHNEDSIPSGSFFVAQPSIRLKFIDLVGKVEGFSTSFVNICTEEINPSLNRFIEHLDTWLNFFSHIGLHAMDITIVQNENICTDDITSFWSELDGKSFFFNYGGLELGDASYIFNVPQKRRDSLTLCDCGFGLERICWAVNKSKSYFDAIGPLSFTLKGKHRLMDFIRTLTLMAASGVVPKQRPHGYRFTQLVRKCLGLGIDSVDLEMLVSYYYTYWSLFMPLVLSLNDCKNTIRDEINRCQNIEICKRLGIKYHKIGNMIYKDTETFIRYLLVNRYERLDSIRDAL